MTLLDLDDDPIAERLRVALRQIATEDLAAPRPRDAPRTRPPWIRPATLVAAIVLLVGITALVIVLRKDDDRTMIVDHGASPVRVIPGPLPERVHFQRVLDLDEVTSADPPRAVWARLESDRIVAMIVVHVMADSGNSRPASLPDAVEVKRETCPAQVIYVLASNVEAAMAEHVRDTLSCAIENGAPRVDAETPDGFVAMEPAAVQPTQWTLMSFDGKSSGSLAVGTYRIRMDWRSATGLWEQRDIANRDVFVQEARTVDLGAQAPPYRMGATYRWEIGPGTWVEASDDGFSEHPLTAEEVAALISGTRVVSEAEWHEWAATVAPPTDPDTVATTAARAIPATSLAPEAGASGS